MNAHQFVSEITGKEWSFTRTNLISQVVTEDEVVVPSEPTLFDEGSAAAVIGGTVYVYDSSTLFSVKHGICLAVVKTGSGNVWCDRFETHGLSWL